MSKLYTGGPYKQVNGDAITANSTNVNGGGIKMPGTSQLVDTVAFGIADNRSPKVSAGVDCGQADWGSFTAATGQSGVVGTGIVDATGIHAGLAQVTKLNHGLIVGSAVNVNSNATGVNTTGVYQGIHRVVYVVDQHHYILNTPFVHVETGITVASSVGNVANQVANNYTMRLVAGQVHGVAETKMSTPASDYGRAKVHKVNALRTRKVATAIRAGYWSPVSGTFSTKPSQTADSLNTDDATVDSTTKYGLKGEFAYRQGTPVPVSGEYEAKTG